MKTRLVAAVGLLALAGLGVWGGRRLVQAATATQASEIPTTRIKKGRVTITVTARGELQGGNSEMLTVPMVGGGPVAITYLREPGELVKQGDVVAESRYHAAGVQPERGPGRSCRSPGESGAGQR